MGRPLLQKKVVANKNAKVGIHVQGNMGACSHSFLESEKSFFNGYN